MVMTMWERYGRIRLAVTGVAERVVWRNRARQQKKVTAW